MLIQRASTYVTNFPIQNSWNGTKTYEATCIQIPFFVRFRHWCMTRFILNYAISSYLLIFNTLTFFSDEVFDLIWESDVSKVDCEGATPDAEILDLVRGHVVGQVEHQIGLEEQGNNDY